jgi:hypothetical protein
LNVFFQLHNYFIEFNHGPGQPNGDDGNDDQQFDQRESPPGLAEIKIREDALANRFAAFKHKLAHPAGKIRMILRPAREPVNRSRVDDGSIFSRIAVVGKHFPQKLFTFSHNSQNGNPTVTRSTHAPFFSLSSLKEEQGRGEEVNIYKLESLTPALPMNFLGAPDCRTEASERRLTSRRPSREPKPGTRRRDAGRR